MMMYGRPFGSAPRVEHVDDGLVADQEASPWPREEPRPGRGDPSIARQHLIATRLPIVGCTPLYTRPIPLIPEQARATRYAPIAVAEQQPRRPPRKQRPSAGQGSWALRLATLGATMNIAEDNTQLSRCRPRCPQPAGRR
jgi:hypothetical protein